MIPNEGPEKEPEQDSGLDFLSEPARPPSARHYPVRRKKSPVGLYVVGGATLLFLLVGAAVVVVMQMTTTTKTVPEPLARTKAATQERSPVSDTKDSAIVPLKPEPSATPVYKGKLTMENFLKIKLGDPEVDVIVILGKDYRVESDKTYGKDITKENHRKCLWWQEEFGGKPRVIYIWFNSNSPLEPLKVTDKNQTGLD